MSLNLDPYTSPKIDPVHNFKLIYDYFNTENNIKGTSYYNMLYLTHNKDVVYFKLSWPGSQNFTITKLRK